MIGKTISHYEIIECLGRGGMGVVYKARDLKLQRVVALKFLAGHLVADPQAHSRFTQEARAASALDHPNIVTVFEIDEADGEVFIAMSYVAGAPLKQLIDERRLGIDQSLELGVQIAEGLACAHAHNIIHRDLNARNVMVTREGSAVITDFGLAKLRGGSELTESGSILGTAAYMSPEQAWGREVDHRSDLFSFGVILYETLTGRLPFKGKRIPALIYSILNDTPAPLEREGVPIRGDISSVVLRALEKRPDDRFASAEDMGAALRGVHSGPKPRVVLPTRRRKNLFRTVSAAATIAILAMVGWWLLKGTGQQTPVETERVKRLVVLPFRNLGESPDPDFAEAITEEIRTQLARVHDLRIVSRTSSQHYGETSKSLRQIGEELGVGFALEGTIYWGRGVDSNQVRINSKLLRVNDDAQIWADAYDGQLSQIFALQREISIKVAQSLGVALGQRERQSLAVAPTGNQEAYQFYLRGNEYLSRGIQSEDLRIAADMYRRAIELDEYFALAYARLARAILTEYWWHPGRTSSMLSEAHDAIQRSLEIDSELAEAHLSLGYHYYWGYRDYGQALAEFETALTDEPNNSELLQAIGLVQRRQGRFQEALDHLERALELDPLSANKSYEIGNTYFRLRNWAQAEKYLDRALAAAPDDLNTIFVKAWMCVYRDGKTDAARNVLEQASRNVDPKVLVNDWALFDMLDQNYTGALEQLTLLDADTAWYLIHKAQILGLMGDEKREQAVSDTARELLARRLQSSPNSITYLKYMSLALAGDGQKDAALMLARQAVDSLPLSRDAFHGGPSAVENLALVASMVGDYELSLNQIDRLLTIPAGLITPQFLRLDPRFAVLRKLKQFDETVGKYSAGSL